MSQMGACNSHIARSFGCTSQAIIRTFRRVQQTGQTTDRTKARRPRVTTPGDDRHLPVIHLWYRMLTVISSSATATGHRISWFTVMRRFVSTRIREYRPLRGIASQTFLTAILLKFCRGNLAHATSTLHIYGFISGGNFDIDNGNQTTFNSCKKLTIRYGQEFRIKSSVDIRLPSRVKYWPVSMPREAIPDIECDTYWYDFMKFTFF